MSSKTKVKTANNQKELSNILDMKKKTIKKQNINKTDIQPINERKRLLKQ